MPTTIPTTEATSSRAAPRLFYWLSPALREKSTCHSTEIAPSRWNEPPAPTTSPIERLKALRAKAIAEGMPLLSEDEILEETRQRRGESAEHEENLY